VSRETIAHKEAKIRYIHLTLNTQLELNELTYSLIFANSFFITNVFIIARPLSHSQIRQSKHLSPYQQHNARVIHSLNFFVAKKSKPDVDKSIYYTCS
jgi:hypothetical protein